MNPTQIGDLRKVRGPVAPPQFSTLTLCGRLVQPNAVRRSRVELLMGDFYAVGLAGVRSKMMGFIG